MVCHKSLITYTASETLRVQQHRFLGTPKKASSVLTNPVIAA